MKEKICKKICYRKRLKTVQGNVIGETIEFINPETMELVKLVVRQEKNNTEKSCHKNCYFRKLQGVSALRDKDRAINPQLYGTDRWRLYHERIWPCYLFACSGCDTHFMKRNSDGIAYEVAYETQLWYEEIWSQKIEQEGNENEE